MVDSEAAVLAAHANHFVNHVKSVVRDLRPRILLADYFSDRHVAGLLDVEERLVRGSAHFLRLKLCKVLLDNFVRLHVPIVVFLNDVVVLGESTFCSLRCRAAKHATDFGGRGLHVLGLLLV